jgi:hypothetical protein
MTIRILGSLLVLPLMATAAPAVRSDILVSTDWLAQHLKDPKVVVLQVSRDRATYDAGHIPGARFFALSDLIVTRDGIMNELPPAPTSRWTIWGTATMPRFWTAEFKNGAPSRVPSPRTLRQSHRGTSRRACGRRLWSELKR